MEELVDNARTVIERGIKEGFVLEVEKRDHVIIEDGIKLHMSVSTNIIKKEKDKRVGDVFETINPKTKIAEIDSFVIIPNYYAILPNHLLVVSNKFVHQISRISIRECEVISKLLNEDNIVCYNGGQASGASQLHKHFHLILSLSSHTIPLGDLVKNGLFEKYFPTSALMFYSEEHKESFIKADSVLKTKEDTFSAIYKRISPIDLITAIRKCEEKVGIRICKTSDGCPLRGWDRDLSSHSVIDVTKSVGYDPHNDSEDQYYLDDFSLVACKYFVAIFPRFKGARYGANLNSISFTGCVFVKNETEFESIVSNSVLKTLSLATTAKC